MAGKPVEIIAFFAMLLSVPKRLTLIEVSGCKKT